MQITRYIPRGINANVHFDTAFNSMLNDMLGGNRAGLRSWAPDVDITENKDSYLIHAELPGIKENEVQITVNNNLLTISGEKKQEVREEKENFVRTERTYGKFERSFTLPNNVKVDSVKAEYKDGVLSITVPKAEEAKARTIQINK